MISTGATSTATITMEKLVLYLTSKLRGILIVAIVWNRQKTFTVPMVSITMPIQTNARKQLKVTDFGMN